MNQRLEELALECYHRYSEHNVDLEKFAKLIVKECAKLAKAKSVSIVNKAELYAEDEDELTSAQAIAWQFLVLEKEIQQHFGVD